MKEYERKAIQEIMRELRLKGHEGGFRYFDSNSGYEIVFEWDSAGISNAGGIVLIELELGGISDWHIQTHLCRLAVMIAQGTSVEKLVWVIDQGAFQSIKNQVNSWLAFFRPVCKVSLPNMEYRTPSGELLK